MTKQGGRERILAAAQDLFHTQGIAATSVDDIAQAAGVGKATFYHHFESKDELVGAIVEALASFYETRVIPAVANGELGIDAVWKTLAFSDRYLRAQGCKKGCPVGNLAYELADTDGQLRDRLARLFTAWERALAAALEGAANKGHLPAGSEPRSLAALVLATYQGATLLSRTSKDIRTYEAATRGLRQLLGTASAPRPQAGQPPEAVGGPSLDPPWLV